MRFCCMIGRLRTVVMMRWCGRWRWVNGGMAGVQHCRQFGFVLRFRQRPAVRRCQDRSPALSPAGVVAAPAGKQHLRHQLDVEAHTAVAAAGLTELVAGLQALLRTKVADPDALAAGTIRLSSFLGLVAKLRGEFAVADTASRIDAGHAPRAARLSKRRHLGWHGARNRAKFPGRRSHRPAWARPPIHFRDVVPRRGNQ